MPTPDVSAVKRTTASGTEPSDGHLQHFEAGGAAERRAGRTGSSGAVSAAEGVHLSDELDEEDELDAAPPLTDAEEAEQEKQRRIEELQKQLEEGQQALEQAIEDGDMSKAAEILDELKGMMRELDALVTPPPAPAPPAEGGGAAPGAPTGVAPQAGGATPQGSGGVPAGGGGYGGGAPNGGGGYGGGVPNGGGGAQGGAPNGGGGAQGGAAPVPTSSQYTPVGAPTAKVQKLIDVATSQQGDPYVFGATGPDKFDCSGLVYYSLNQAGARVPRLTAQGYQEMFKDSAVPKDELQPGDLVFFWSPNDRGIPPGRASHVEIYLGNGMTMGTDNPSEGARIEPINWDTYIGGARVPALYE